jgi:hypothetical protein
MKDNGVCLFEQLSEVDGLPIDLLQGLRPDATDWRPGDASQLDPIRVLRDAPPPRDPRPAGRPLRVGVCPVTANPWHWGHTLLGLLALQRLDLDVVVYIVHGTIRHKPVDPTAMVGVNVRHALAAACLRPLSPWLLYSDLGKNNACLGEKNVHALRHLNRHVDADFIYISSFEGKERFLFMATNLVRYAEEARLWLEPQHRLSWHLFDRAAPGTSGPPRLPSRWGSGRVTLPVVVEPTPFAESLRKYSSSAYRAALHPGLVPPIVHDYVVSHGLYRS